MLISFKSFSGFSSITGSSIGFGSSLIRTCSCLGSSTGSSIVSSTGNSTTGVSISSWLV